MDSTAPIAPTMPRFAALLAALLSCLAGCASDYSPASEPVTMTSAEMAPPPPAPPADSAALGSSGGVRGLMDEGEGLGFAGGDAGANTKSAPAKPASPGGPAAKGQAAAQSEPPAQRMLFHDGFVKLEALDPAATIDTIVALVKQVGGYVETQTRSAATLRVPIASFGATYAATLKLGKVLQKTLTTEDITEAFADATLRKRLTEAALTKLHQLLAKATTAAERLALLKEIGALEERRERADAEVRALAGMARFSRLKVEALPPERNNKVAGRVPLGAFRWIEQLRPDSSSIMLQGKRFELPPPSGFVPVTDMPFWMAESATAAIVRATRLKNEPRGSASFWAEAVRAQLSERYKLVGVESRGAFTVVHLRGDDEDFRYDVGVLAKGDALVVVEAFYPTQGDATRYAPAVLATLQGYKGDGK